MPEHSNGVPSLRPTGGRPPSLKPDSRLRLRAHCCQPPPGASLAVTVSELDSNGVPSLRPTRCCSTGQASESNKNNGKFLIGERETRVSTRAQNRRHANTMERTRISASIRSLQEKISEMERSHSLANSHVDPKEFGAAYHNLGVLHLKVIYKLLFEAPWFLT